MEISEKGFESQVKDLAKLFGWKYYHTWRSIHSPAGFPDCVMVRPPRLIFAELKSNKGTLTPEQEEWLEILKECQKIIIAEPLVISGGKATLEMGKAVANICMPEVYLWRPHQIEEIAEILR